MAEHPKAGSGKKFSITIQVPDDVAGQWPNQSTAERLIEEVYRAMGGAPVARPAAARVRPVIVILFLAALFALGVVAGYLGARAYAVFSTPANRPATMPGLQAEPASTPQVTASGPASAAGQPAGNLSAPVAAAEPQSPAATASPEGAVRTVDAPAVVYHVQIGAFRLRENADSLVQLLDQDGFKATVLQSGKLYIVYIGTFADQKDADLLASALRARRYDVVVTHTQGD